MATEPKSRRRRRKKILRKTDGSLFDATERRRITPGELRDYVRDGGLFEARRQENGADCTYEVLQSVLGVGMLESLVPGLGGNPLAGLPGLGGLSALGNNGALAELGRLLGNGRDDRGWDDWDEPRRKSQRRSDGDRDWADGEWSEDPPKREPRRDRDWADPDHD